MAHAREMKRVNVLSQHCTAAGGPASQVRPVATNSASLGSICAEGQKLLTDVVALGSMPEQTVVRGRPFPLVLQPAAGVGATRFVQLQEYFQKHHQQIQRCASLYGSVYFKGFDIANGEEWASVLYSSGLKEVEYVGGAAVRKLIVGSEQVMENPQVLTTNESPPSEPIPFHNELAQTPKPPSHISFFCTVPSKEGGSTPIVRTDLVCDWLREKHPAVLDKFEKLGVRYIRIVPEEDDASSALGRSWKSTFQVKTKDKAEEVMRSLDMSWEWYGNGDCKTISKILPAVRTCSNGNQSFMNQVVAAYTGWIDKRNVPEKAVVFGDGSELPAAEMGELVAFMREKRCAFRWGAGDFVVIDNTVTAHSREPFAGRRQVLASVANGAKAVDDAAGTHLVLSNSCKMPAVGLGMWKVPKEKCAEVTYEALKAGYRCIDEACDYGNEVECGQGIARALKEGVVARKDLFVTSKLWNTYHRKEHVKAACLRSLKDLGLDYLDLYLVHFPIAMKFVPFETRYPPEWIHDPSSPTPRMEEDAVPFRETWEAMEELVREGLVKNIGVANMGAAMLRDVLSYAKIKPAVLQVELHPYNTQETLLRFCRQKGVAVTGFSNLGAASYVEIGGATAQDSCLQEPVVTKIAAAHGKTPAQVVLRWAIQRGTAIVPKTASTKRLAENRDLFDFALTPSQMEEISALNKNRRFNDPGVFCESAFGAFTPIYE
eukprot:TRINITY_DN122732_c0_g1_i1.p1 TRINITY_DN122732_c0_g1~~TRINITY_DN122732_c0_g1_i1.p1  ORF type:complete len:715 (+),score=198.73 TRINITY_DN122732_c0_g1_i1:75-2219(+)